MIRLLMAFAGRMRGSSSPTYVPSLKFNDKRNSMYLGAVPT